VDFPLSVACPALLIILSPTKEKWAFCSALNVCAAVYTDCLFFCFFSGTRTLLWLIVALRFQCVLIPSFVFNVLFFQCRRWKQGPHTRWGAGAWLQLPRGAFFLFIFPGEHQDHFVKFIKVLGLEGNLNCFRKSRYCCSPQSCQAGGISTYWFCLCVWCWGRSPGPAQARQARCHQAAPAPSSASDYSRLF
jgi:hypothetical protein